MWTKHINALQLSHKELWQNTSQQDSNGMEVQNAIHNESIDWRVFSEGSIQISSGTSPPWKNEKQETCCNAACFVTSSSSSSFISGNWNSVSFLDLQVSWEMLPALFQELTQSTCICSVGTAISKVFKYRSKSDTAANATPWRPQWVQSNPQSSKLSLQDSVNSVNSVPPFQASKLHGSTQTSQFKKLPLESSSPYTLPVTNPPPRPLLFWTVCNACGSSFNFQV